jgi:hypothetical protein
MFRPFIILTILFLPVTAFADYDAEAIKRGIEQAEPFQIKGWRKSDNGLTWIATTGLKNTVIAVGKKETGSLFAINDSGDALRKMIRCTMLGIIGIAPTEEEQRWRIFEVVKTAAASQGKRSAAINNVVFTVSPMEIGGNVFLSCTLAPSE